MTRSIATLLVLLVALGVLLAATAIRVAQSQQSQQHTFPEFIWKQSLPIRSGDPGITKIGGTEVRALAVFDGKLFAAIGYWMDTERENLALPGAQVLRLDELRIRIGKLIFSLMNGCRPGGEDIKQSRTLKRYVLASMTAARSSIRQLICSLREFGLTAVWKSFRVSLGRLHFRGLAYGSPGTRTLPLAHKFAHSPSTEIRLLELMWSLQERLTPYSLVRTTARKKVSSGIRNRNGWETWLAARQRRDACRALPSATGNSTPPSTMRFRRKIGRHLSDMEESI